MNWGMIFKINFFDIKFNNNILLCDLIDDEHLFFYFLMNLFIRGQ